MRPTAKTIASVGVLGVYGLFALGSLDTKESSTGGGATSPTVPASSSAAPPASAPPPAPPIAITARQLFAEYEANEVAADEKYKGKHLLVTGKVQSIDKDFLDNIVVHIRTSNEFSAAMATLESSEKRSAAQLSKGQAISVLCTGSGRIIGSPSLSDCVLK